MARAVASPAVVVHRRRRSWDPYLLIAPSLILTVTILFFPLAYSLYVSFISFNLARPNDTRFVGLQNYVDNLTQSEFPLALLNTLVFTVGAVSIEFCLGLCFALLLQREFRGQGLVRTCFMLPLFLTPSIVALNWLFMFYPRMGVIPWLASFLGVPQGFPFLANPSTAMAALILVDVWRATPFMFLVLLAGMQGLPQEALEAAAIDGASPWQVLRHVSLPILSPLILIALSIRGMDAFREFDLVFLLTGGGPGRTTEVIGTLAYRTGFNYYDMGRASAMAYIILFLVLIFSFYFVRKLHDLPGDDMSEPKAWREAIRFLLIGIGLVWSLGPLFLMYSASFKTDDILNRLPPVLIFSPVLDNYRRLLEGPFFQYLWNTLIVATSTTVLALVCGSLAAYSFTRFKFPGSESLPIFYLVMRMLPRFVLVIPYYLLMRQIGLLNTSAALVLAYTSFSLPFVIWLMIGFFKEIPIELEEAGMVDGCTRIQVFVRIVIPLVAPGLAATSIFAFLLGWNELLFSVVLAGRDTRTLPTLATSVVSNERGIEWGPLNAMGSLVLLPVIAMALLVQRHIVKGMTMGAVKG